MNNTQKITNLIMKGIIEGRTELTEQEEREIGKIAVDTVLFPE